MEKISISIIIPCYNMEKYLPECLDSILQQSLDSIEIICIDDGSTDSTLEILNRYRTTDHRIHVIHQENQGVSASRNTGIMHATGEYVAFIDPDDFYPDFGTLELLYTKATENNVQICGGSFSDYNVLDKKIITQYTGDFAKYTFDAEALVAYRDYQFDYGYHRFIYSRRLLLDHGIFFPPYSRFQDPPFFIRAMLAAESFYAVPTIVYRYRCGFQEKPTSWPKKKLHDMMRGYLENLRLSSEAELAQLHALTVRRFETKDVLEPVMKSLQEQDPMTLELLLQIHSAVCPDMLQNCGMDLTDEGLYILQEFKALQEACSPAGSGPPPILMRLRKKISGGLQCCRDHGIWYTFFLLIKKAAGYFYFIR